MKELIKKLFIFGLYIFVACVSLNFCTIEITINHKHQFDKNSCIKMDHNISSRGFSLKHHHDFRGNLYNPLRIELSNQ
jgi:hypothetical protein